jgi:hypothetical protein
MGAIATLLKRLGNEHGIEIDDDELTELGLSDIEEFAAGGETNLDVLGDTLSGEAAGAVEIFLNEPVSMLASGKALESDGLMWEPIIREGQWAVRPGARGQKVRRPLKVIAGKSTNQRKQIGLQDIVDAFDDRAIEHVTVPTSHDNDVTQNTGFIKGLKIVMSTIKDKATKKDKKVAVLMGGYDIRKADIKTSMLDGSIASRSAGLLYDYVNTETGKTYPVALEHVALTNKPWITGMKAFGRKLVGKKLSETIGLSLSDDEPDEAELLSDDDPLDGLELAELSTVWAQDEDPDWLREQTSVQLRAARAKKAAENGAAGEKSWVVMEGLPYYRCVRAKPGTALIADGYGDEANYWAAPIKVVDGFVELEEDLGKWEAVKREYVKDEDRSSFPEGREPLKDEAPEIPIKLSRRELAVKARKARASKTDLGVPPEDNETTSRGGEHMAGESGTLQLGEEAQKAILAAEARAKAAEEKADKLDQQMQTLLGAHVANNADANVRKITAMGFTPEKGFSGVLARCRDLFSADDGEPAVQSDKFSTDTNSEGTLSLSEAIMSVFDAFEKAEDGMVKLGEQVVQPLASKEAEKTKDGEVKLGDDGKPLPKEEEDPDFSALSEEEQQAQLLADNAEMAAMLRIPLPSANGSTKKEGE